MIFSNNPKDQSSPYFFVNGKKVYTIFNPPHLLKSTRNAFLKYNIQFDKEKIAKFDHLRQCFSIDKRKRFQGLRKNREAYLNMNGRKQLKMKVCFAARTFSNTMAAAIESMIGTNSVDNLPVSAMHSAEFIHDMDCLFNTFNGRQPYAKTGKPYRRCMPLKSPHRIFWLKLLPKIQSWTFLTNNNSVAKTNMPFKSGWITTINATMQLFQDCQKNGFRFFENKIIKSGPD